VIQGATEGSELDVTVDDPAAKRRRVENEMEQMQITTCRAINTGAVADMDDSDRDELRHMLNILIKVRTTWYAWAVCAA
jgi:hypothetical protein